MHTHIQLFNASEEKNFIHQDFLLVKFCTNSSLSVYPVNQIQPHFTEPPCKGSDLREHMP